MRLWAIAALVVLGLAAEASAATFAVEVSPAGVPAWQADALARTLPGDIADDDLAPAAANADLVLRATLSDGALAYEVTPLRGVITLRGLDRARVARALRDVLRAAVIERASPRPVPRAARVPAPRLGIGAVLALLAVIALLAAPFAIGRRVRGLHTARRAGVAIAVVVAAGAAMAIAGDRVPAWSGALLVAGGIAWGTFAAVMLPVLFPPLGGLGRVEPDDLLRVLRAWAALAAQRVLAAALTLGPALAALWGVCRLLDVPPLVTWAVLAPAWGLALRLALRAGVEVRAVRLDAALVDGAATADNPWHAVVRGYLAGSLRRAGGDPARDDLLLLPGKTDAVAVYGLPPRIVVPRAWLELALAPYGRPHDYAAPRVSTLEWNEWNAGLVLPVEVGAPVATRDQRQPRAEEDRDPEEVPPFGEVTTLAGVVEPEALDPRVAHRPEEDPLWLDYDEGEEPDGTDPSDKDFLFGLLVHALGRIQRGEHLLATFTARGTRAMTTIGEIYASLNFARHHRIQDLAWRAKRREDWLSARAHAPELARRSAEILAALGDDPAFAAYARTPRRGRAALWIRRVALAGAVALGVTVVTRAVLDALAYHERQTDHGEEK